MDGACEVPRNCGSISGNGMSNNVVDPIVPFVNHRSSDDGIDEIMKALRIALTKDFFAY